MMNFNFTCQGVHLVYRHLSLCKYCNKIANTKSILCQNRFLSSSFPAWSECPENTKKKHNPISTNFIIEKFDKMLNDLSVNQNKEIIYSTNFGSIRFDTNIDLIKLKTDFSKNVITHESDTPDPLHQSTETNLENDNFIDNVYFNNSNSHNNDNLYEVNDYQDNCNSLKNSNLNYIDNQYMRIGSSQETNSSNSYNSESKPDILSLNYIDTQIVGLATTNDEKKAEETALNGNYEELNCHYSFEDSIDENLNKNFVRKTNKPDKNYDSNRESLENKLLEMTEEGSKYISELKDNFEKNSDTKNTSNKNIDEKKNLVSDTEALTPDLKKKENIENITSSVKKMQAYKFVMQERKNELISTKKEIKGEILEHERYKKILVAVPSYSLHVNHDMAKELQKNILYNNNDIVAIYKPYGIPVHGGGSKNHDRLNIINALPILAEFIKEEKLEPIHRLDKNTTGVLLLAKTDKRAEELKKMFKDHKIKKSYLAIVKGIPDPINGIIDIPIAEGKIDKFERMVLRPDISNYKGKDRYSKKAMTRYKVLSTAPSCALLEVNPITGIKHQVRVHLGFGINCPIIGDHKYSFLTKMAPQKLPNSVLDKLGIKQTKVRTLPMFLHAFKLTIPIIDSNGKEIFIQAIPPKSFRLALQILKLSSRHNRLTNEHSDIIYGYE